MKSEPVVNTAIVVAAIVAGLQLLRSFGVSITDEQNQAIVDFATVALQIAAVLGGGVFARSLVTPDAKVEQIAAESARTGVPQA